MTLVHHHGPSWLIRPRVTTWPLVAIRATNVDSDPDCYSAVDPDIAFGSRLDLDTPGLWGRSIGHPGQYDSICGTAFRQQQGHRLQPRPEACVWPLVAKWATDVNTDPDCYRDQDMALVGSTGQPDQCDSCSGHWTPTWP